MINLSIDPSKMTALSDENCPQDGDHCDVVLMKGEELAHIYLCVEWRDFGEDWIDLLTDEYISGQASAMSIQEYSSCTYYYAPAGSIS